MKEEIDERRDGPVKRERETDVKIERETEMKMHICAHCNLHWTFFELISPVTIIYVIFITYINCFCINSRISLVIIVGPMVCTDCVGEQRSVIRIVNCSDEKKTLVRSARVQILDVPVPQSQGQLVEVLVSVSRDNSCWLNRSSFFACFETAFAPYCGAVFRNFGDTDGGLFGRCALSRRVEIDSG